MVKTKYKILTLLLSLVMILACTIMVTSCSEPEKDKVMNVSLNPSIEFVLDANNKVVSVSAINDEGNYIIANATFVGLSAEDAVDLFVEISEANGFVDASLSNNNLKIEISGEDAQKIYNKVKASAEEVFAELDINVQVNFEAISKDDLKKLVGDCMKELTSSDIAKLSEEELVNRIKQSREETKDLLSQELKEIYYNSRADEIIKAKADKLKSIVESNQANPLVSAFMESISEAYIGITDAITSLDELYTSKFLDINSDYQKAVTKFMTDKKALLEARINESANVANLKQAAESAENAIKTAKDAADLALSTAKTGLINALAGLEDLIDSINNVFKLNINQKDIASAINSAKNNFKATFSSEYKTEIEDNYWKDALKVEVSA